MIKKTVPLVVVLLSIFITERSLKAIPMMEGDSETGTTTREEATRTAIVERNERAAESEDSADSSSASVASRGSETVALSEPSSGNDVETTAVSDPSLLTTVATGIAIQDYLASMVKSAPEKMSQLQSKIETAQAPISGLGSQDLKDIAGRYLERVR